MKITLSEPTQACIEAAINQAGEFGTIEFPNGVYDVSLLIADVPNQTWELDRFAFVSRIDGDVLLTIAAEGLRIRGGVFDGNRGDESDASNGFIASNVGLDIEDARITGIGGWGMIFQGGNIPFRMHHCMLDDIGYAPVLWSSVGWSVDGPEIAHCKINRNIGFRSQGAIHIRSSGTPAMNWVKAPKVLYTDIVMPQVPNLSAAQDPNQHANSVGIEIWNGIDAMIEGCSITYSKIGISLGGCRNGKVIGNSVNSAFQYGIEFAGLSGNGGMYNLAVGNVVNSVNGQPASAAAPSRGVSLSGGVQNSAFAGNQIYWCSVAGAANAGSS